MSLRPTERSSNEPQARASGNGVGPLRRPDSRLNLDRGLTFDDDRPGHGVTALDAASAGGEEWTENRPRAAGCRNSSSGRRGGTAISASCFAQRTLKVRYRQTLLGVAWALLQPLAGLVIFTIVFGRLAKLPSDGLPYAVFVYPAMCLWTYVSMSVSAAAAELPQNPHLVTRVYFPRILSPAAAVVPGLLDFALALALTAVLLVVYEVTPGPQVLLVPLWMAAAAIVAFGVGTWLAAINVKYRDVRHVLPFLLQTWFFLSPMVFPSSLVGDDWRARLCAQPARRAWSTVCAGRSWAVLATATRGSSPRWSAPS